MSLFSLVIGGMHSLFAFVHLSDAMGAIDLIHGPGYTPNDSVDAKMVKHLVMIVGSFHAFVGVLFLMLATQSNKAIRKCAHGIHGSVLVPIMIWVLVKAPPTGKALPNLTTSMPMPLMWFWIVVDFLAILLGGSDSKSKKE
eukprot:m.31708 g.31708  ORF g.31708 m.31708 type:complete len:141 (+) comp6961_c0_seq1:626-1048(+)